MWDFRRTRTEPDPRILSNQTICFCKNFRSFFMDFAYSIFPISKICRVNLQNFGNFAALKMHVHMQHSKLLPNPSTLTVFPRIQLILIGTSYFFGAECYRVVARSVHVKSAEVDGPGRKVIYILYRCAGQNQLMRHWSVLVDHPKSDKLPDLSQSGSW